MADPFLTLNGMGDQYLSRADDNLLDANTAHTFQGAGVWFSGGGLFGLVFGAPPVPSPFGGLARGGSYNAALASFRYVDEGLIGQPVTPGQVVGLASSALITEGGNSDFLRLQVRWFNAAGDQIGAYLTLDEVANPLADTWYDLAGSVTVPGGAAFASAQVQRAGDLAPSAPQLWVNRAMFSVTRTTFVPSLRIVGSLDAEMDAALGVNVAEIRLTGNRSGNFGFDWLTTGGADFFVRFGDGTGQRAQGMGAMGPVLGVRTLYRVTFDEPAGGVWEGFLNGGSVFTGPPVGGGAAAYAADATLGVMAGQNGLGPMPGDCYRFTLRDGIDGPVVYQMDAADVLAAI